MNEAKRISDSTTNPNAKISEEEFVGCIHCGLKIHFDQGETRHVLSGSIFCKKKRGMTLMEAEPKLKPKVNPRLRAEEGIGEADERVCPECKIGKNSPALGGTRRCFHCDSCGYVNCVDYPKPQSDEGKPTESAQQDAPKDVVACPSCGVPIFVRPNGGIVAHYAPGGKRCIANETLYVSRGAGNETKEVQELLNSMKVIDRYQWRQECRSDVLTSLMYELAAFRAAKAAPSTPVSAPQEFEKWWDHGVSHEAFENMKTIAKAAWNASRAALSVVKVSAPQDVSDFDRGYAGGKKAAAEYLENAGHYDLAQRMRRDLLTKWTIPQASDVVSGQIGVGQEETKK